MLNEGIPKMPDGLSLRIRMSLSATMWNNFVITNLRAPRNYPHITMGLYLAGMPQAAVSMDFADTQVLQNASIDRPSGKPVRDSWGRALSC